MDAGDWDDFGRALKFVLMVAGLGAVLFLLLLGSLTFGASTRSTRYFPDSWKSCTDMKPVPGADDGSQVAVCTDDDDKRYEIVYRSLHKACVANTDAKVPRDDYQHFLCEEKWELMLRPYKAPK